MKDKKIYNIEDYRATAKLLKNAEAYKRISELDELKKQIGKALVVLGGSGTAFFGSYVALISNDNLSIGDILLFDVAMAAGAIGTMLSCIALWEEALEIAEIHDYFTEQGINIEDKPKQKTLFRKKQKEKK